MLQQHRVNAVPPTQLQRSVTQTQSYQGGSNSIIFSVTQLQAENYTWKGNKCATSESLSSAADASKSHEF